MNIKLDLEQRLWTIDNLGSLPSTTALLKIVDPIIGDLAPKEHEVSIDGLNFQADGDTLQWDHEVEAKNLPPVEYEFPEIVVESLKKHFAKKSFQDPSLLTLKMIEVFGL